MEGPNGSLAWWWPKAQWASQRGPLDPGRSPFHPWGYFQVSPSPNLKTPHQSRRPRNHFPTFFFTLAPKLPAKLFHRRGHRDFYIYVCTPDQPHLPSHPRLCHPKSPNSRPTAAQQPWLCRSAPENSTVAVFPAPASTPTSSSTLPGLIRLYRFSIRFFHGQRKLIGPWVA